MIPYGKQDISQADIDAVVAVLQSDFITQGPVIQQFEQRIADYTGAAHCYAVNSATSALHLACLALDVGKHDLVWTSPITFVASANCARYCGADVDFVDIDPATFNLCPQALHKKLEQHRAQQLPLPKVVIAVHMAGQSCQMRAIRRLADEYGFKIIEDASHAIGGKYENEPVGNCRYGDICVFSFHPVKIITTAEGGALTTNNAELAHTIAHLRSHGVTRDAAQWQVADEHTGDWYYEQHNLGFNYRMTELQAALGLSQLQRLDEFVARRHVLAKRYQELLAGLSLHLPHNHPDSYSALHLYIVQVQGGPAARKALFEELRRDQINVNVHYIPVHLQPYYRQLGFGPGQFEKAETYYAQALSLPMFPTLQEQQQEQVAKIIRQNLQGA